MLIETFKGILNDWGHVIRVPHTSRCHPYRTVSSSLIDCCVLLSHVVAGDLAVYIDPPAAGFKEGTHDSGRCRASVLAAFQYRVAFLQVQR